MPLHAAIAVAAIVGQQIVAQGGVGRPLADRIDGGVDLIALGIGRAAEAADHDGAHHLGHVGRLQIHFLAMDLGMHRIGQGRLVFLVTDEAEAVHAPEDIVPAHPRPLRIDHRVVARGRLGQAGDHGHLGQGQLGRGLAVVDLGGGGETVGPLAQVDLVQVQLEDLLLAQLVLDLQGQQDFVELAQIGLLAAEEEVAGHLHGDGGAALPLLAGADQVEGGAQQPLVVHAGMLEEAVVLGGQDGLDEPGREFRVFQGGALHLAEFGNQRPVAGIDPQRHLQLHLAQGFDVGQLRGEIQPGAEQAETAEQDQGEGGGHAKCDQFPENGLHPDRLIKDSGAGTDTEGIVSIPPVRNRHYEIFVFIHYLTYS